MSFSTVENVDISQVGISEASHSWFLSIQMQMMWASYGSVCGDVCVCKSTFKSTLCQGRLELGLVFPLEVPVADEIGPQSHKRQ